MLANFKATLAARKIHQVDLALQLRIDPTLLSQIVNERKQADASLRARIAGALAVDEHWLFSTFTSIPVPRTVLTEPESAPAMACASGVER